MKVFLIRHAETNDARNKVTQQASSGIIINSSVLKSAKELKQKLGTIDKVFSSPMLRAKNTAELIFGAENYTTIDYIGEYETPIELYNASSDTTHTYWETSHYNDKYNLDWVPEGGESFRSISKRVDDFYNFLCSINKIEPSSRVAVVGHGTFFRHLMLRIANVPSTEYPQLIFDVLRKLKLANLDYVELDLKS